MADPHHNPRPITTALLRDYRKGNWTLQETLILIEAKKMDDERRRSMRMRLHSNTPVDPHTSPKPTTELRWKWVEDYCWNRGCFRSQNQCNDKWDNLMRDFKKVREFNKNVENESESRMKYYWDMEKGERKERSLPTNMVFQIYQALVEVVERGGGGGGGGGGGSVPVLMHQVVTLPPLPPPEVVGVGVGGGGGGGHQGCTSTRADSDTSEHNSNSSAKRRRIIDQGAATTTTAAATATSSEEISRAITKSASVIVEAINATQEAQERRHREILTLHERRLLTDQSTTDIHRQGINALDHAINNLAHSILTLASSLKNNH